METTRKQSRPWLALFRLAVQTAALVLTVAGSYTLIRDMGMPETVFMISVVLVGMFFCGWLCPFGTVQEWLRHVGKNVTGLTLRVPPRLDRYLSLSRYLLLPLFWVLLHNAYEPRHAFIGFFAGRPAEVAAYALAGVVLVLALFTDRPFCRYVCSFGAIHGMLSIPRLFAVKRDDSACVRCGKCDSSCGMGVAVSVAHAVRDPHCINCFACVSACPVPGALTAGLALPSRADAVALKRKYSPEKDRPGDTRAA